MGMLVLILTFSFMDPCPHHARPLLSVLCGWSDEHTAYRNTERKNKHAHHEMHLQYFQVKPESL
jgi:hypothetical protein